MTNEKRNLTLQEKIDLLNGLMDGEIVSGIENEDGRVKIDYRKVVIERLEKEGIAKRQVAQAIGIPPQNFYNWINGKIQMRFEYVERVMWLLADGNATTSNQTEQTI